MAHGSTFLGRRLRVRSIRLGLGFTQRYGPWQPVTMEVTVRFVAVLLLVSLAAIGCVLVATLLSVGIVFVLKWVFAALLRLLSVSAEIVVALAAAVTSGGTVTLSVLVAAGCAGMAVPASLLELRVAVAAIVSMTAIIFSSCTVLYLACPIVDVEIAVAVTSAAALAVACASAWAVGVMSLIEKETQHVGLKMTSLLDAVRHNKHFMLRLLVKLHSGFKNRDRDLDLALLHAVKAGYAQCTEILLSAGANPDTADAHGNTALILACEAGAEDVVRLLTDVGCDVNRKSNMHCTALHHAAKWGFRDCVRHLLDKGADVDAQDAHWRTPLMLAATHAQDAAVLMRMLVEANCNVDIVGAEGRRAIHYAAARRLDLSALLLAGADVNARDDEGNLALHYAAHQGDEAAVRALLTAGCDACAVNAAGRNGIHLVAMQGNVACVETFISAGCDPNVLDVNGKSPLCWAVDNNNINVIVHLLQYNCIPPPCSVESNHVDPIQVALDKRHVHLVRPLLIGGFSCKALFDWLNHTPEELWIEGKIEHVSWLRTYLGSPAHLSHLVRLVIRRHLGADTPNRVQYLPLPSKLKDYVSFRGIFARELHSRTCDSEYECAHHTHEEHGK